jgi:hypothetical protein
MSEKSTQAASGEMVERFERRDWLVAAVLFGVSLAMRVPFRSHFAYHWDSAQFALAIEHYNVSEGLPHFPGYFLYVMLGRVVNLFVGDPHASLVWISVFSGAALVGLGYLLAAALFGRDCGLVTGCLLASSSLCWFQSEVAFTTLPDGVLVTTTALVCWRAMRRGGGWAWVFVMAVMLAVVAGVRQQTAVVLCPLWVYTFWRFPRSRWRKFVVGLLVTGLFCAAWFIPMVELSGGIGAYLRSYLAMARVIAPLTARMGGFETLTRNSAYIAAVCSVGLLGAVVPGVAEFYSWVTRGTNRRAALASRSEQLRFMALWIVPMVAFGIVVFTVMPGYVLCYFPGVAILVAMTLSRLVGRIAGGLGQHHSHALGMVVGAIILINSAVFLLPAQRSEWLRASLPETATHIRDHDQQLGRWFRAIRDEFHPDEVLICHEGQSFYWGILHFQYHLPEYQNCLLTTDSALLPPLNKKLWYVKDRRVEFVDRFELRGRKQLILVVPPGGAIDAFTNVFDVALARKWDIPGSAPLYILTPRASDTTRPQ